MPRTRRNPYPDQLILNMPQPAPHHCGQSFHEHQPDLDIPGLNEFEKDNHNGKEEQKENSKRNYITLPYS